MVDSKQLEREGVSQYPSPLNSSSDQFEHSDSTEHTKGITEVVTPSMSTFRLFRCPPYQTGFLAKACENSGLSVPLPTILGYIGIAVGMIISMSLFNEAFNNPFVPRFTTVLGFIFIVVACWGAGIVIGKIICAPFGPTFSADEIKRLGDPVVERFFATTIAAFKAGILSEYNQAYEQEAKKRISKFVGQYRPIKEMLNLFFSRFSPKEGEFLVYFSKDAANFILTNQRFIFRDTTSNNYVEIDLSDLQFCKVKEAWKITFDFQSGESRTYKFDYDYRLLLKVLSFCVAAQSK